MPGFDELTAAGQELTEPALVVLDLEAADRDEATAILARRLADAGRIDDYEGFLEEVRRREHQLATGLPGGVGMPHARTRHAAQVSIAVGITAYGHSLDFGASDGPATVVLLLATPADSFSLHLQLLAALARSLSKQGFRESLRRAYDPEVIAELINSTVDFGAV
ncbi:PTS sugar transporter subunit IIA [Zafaria sp. Z1313]|uniref:PTS sugar transporter subunit IIA n=1 Tax=unclassified Zafaria TaxID=2828765 RepID=UPI002E77E015|nr:PTS sugar transporter subunit IIA [Zafaria sp. J156]MEE1620459.1 PTS sugar transporter subunit IIA [Zafaria sp. J156]